MKHSIFAQLFLSAMLGFLITQSAAGFIPGSRWSWTASGGTGSYGDPITLTWSFAAEGTSTDDGPSDLISFLDDIIGAGPGGSDLTQRPWFQYFEQSFDRWGQLGGITYVYEPNDDGVPYPSSYGSLGVRGDVRIGGAYIDGQSNVLAYNYFPNSGDMVLDTGDSSFYSSASNNYRRLRNVIMHEHGHGIGVYHVESDDASFLMEPFLTTAFDGPQYDEIRAIQWFYGDPLEKTNGGQGNDTALNATSLGAISDGQTASVGTDTGFDTFIDAAETDFVSIDERSGDFDYYSFTVSEPSTLDAVLAPQGATYLQGSQGGSQSTSDTLSIGDLALAVFDIDGSSVLASVDETGAGSSESLTDISLAVAGEYFVRVTASSDDNIQFYRLDLSVESSITFLAADFDEDGDVDGDDFLIWQNAFETSLDGDADADGDGDTDGDDFLIWQTQFGTTSGSGSVGSAVPEPTSIVLVVLALAPFFAVCRCGRVSSRTSS